MLHVPTCAREYTCHVYVCAGWGTASGVILRNTIHLLYDGGLFLALNLTTKLTWLASEQRDPAVSLPSAGITSTHACTSSFLMWIWGCSQVLVLRATLVLYSFVCVCAQMSLFSSPLRLPVVCERLNVLLLLLLVIRNSLWRIQEPVNRSASSPLLSFYFYVCLNTIKLIMVVQDHILCCSESLSPHQSPPLLPPPLPIPSIPSPLLH